MLLEDLLVALVVLLLAGLHFGGVHRFQLKTWFVSNGLGLFCLILVLAWLATSIRLARRRRLHLSTAAWIPLQLVRDWLPFVLLLVGYENILGLVSSVRHVLYDEALMRLDLLLFPQHPTLWLEQFVTPGRTAWFSFFYLSLYLYPLVSGGLLYLSGRLSDFRQFMLTFTVIGLIGYLGYLCVPVIGPRYYFERYYHVALSSGQALPATADLRAWLHAPFSAIADRLSYDRAIASGEARNCFPSLHTAWALVVLIFSWKKMRWLFWIYLFPVASLLLSTLYLRFHYVVDLIAGAILAVAGAHAIPRAERWWSRRAAPTAAPPREPAIAPWRWLTSYVASRRSLWPHLFFLGGVAPLYITCLPTGLCEAHRGEDGAELVAAAVRGGVAHPTGYPLYLLAVRGLCWLFRGADPIDVAHLFSCLCALTAGSVLLETVRRLLRRFFAPQGVWLIEVPALTAACVFCFLGTVWNQAVIAEVYAPHALFVALVLWQLSRLLTDPERRAPRVIWLALSFGLGLCHHLTLLHLLPAALLTLLLVGALSWRSALAATAAGAAGLLPYLTLLLSARRHPVLSWGNPDTLPRLLATISGAQYRFRLRGGAQGVLQRIAERCALVSDAGHLVMGIGLLGAVIVLYWTLTSQRREQRFMLAWLAVAAVAVSANLLGSGLYDIEDLRSYFIPTEMVFAAAVGLGVAAVAWALSEQRALTRAVPYVVTTLAGFTVASVVVRNAPAADVHGVHGLDAEVRRIVREAPPNALLIGHGDGLMFGLWYERFVRSGRRDLDILNRDLLAQDWYITSVGHFTERMRWPTRFDWHDERLNPVEAVLAATVRANYPFRPILALRDYDALTGCRRDARKQLICPTEQAAAAAE